MSAEIKVTSGLTVSKTNGPNAAFNTTTQSIDMAGNKFSAGCLSIGTGSHEVLTIGADQSTDGRWSYFKNLDATNYVEIGVDVTGTFGPLLRLAAGQSCVCPVTTSTVYAKANTGAVILQYFILQA